jgi:hypothetical protein
MADLRITVDGRDSDADSLRAWLGSEPGFRGQLRQGETPSPVGAMAASTQLTAALDRLYGIEVPDEGGLR